MVSWGVPCPTWCQPGTGTGCVFRTVDFTEGCLLNRGERGGNEKAVVLFFLWFFSPSHFHFFQGWWVTWPWKLIQQETPWSPSNIQKSRRSYHQVLLISIGKSVPSTFWYNIVGGSSRRVFAGHMGLSSASCFRLWLDSSAWLSHLWDRQGIGYLWEFHEVQCWGGSWAS